MAPSARLYPLWPDRKLKPEPGSVRINWAHPLAQGLKGYWLFNEGAGPPINLVTGKRGTFVDKPVWVGTVKGKALSVDGVDDYFDTGEAMNAGAAGNYSIGLVFKSSSSAAAALMGQYDNTAPGSNILIYGGTTYVRSYMDGFNLDSTSNPYDGIYHHVQAVYFRTTNGYRLYLDGVNEASGDSNSSGAPDTVTTTMKFGFGTALGFKATIFALGYFYDRNLTIAEVNLLRTHPYSMLEPVLRRVRHVGDAASTLSLPTLASGAVLFAPTVAPGAVTLSLPTIASGAQMFAPSLAYVLSLPTIGAAAQTFAPTVTVGAVTLVLPTIATGATLFTPALSYVMSLPTIASGGQLFAPTLAVGAVALVLPTIASGAALLAPSLAYVVALPTLASGAQLFGPTVTTGAVTLSLPTIASGQQLYPPAATQGAVLLPTVASAEQTFAPTVTPVYTLGLPTIPAGAATAAPALAYAMTLPTIAGSSAIFAPTLRSVVALPAIATTTQLFEPSLAIGAVGLSLPALATSTQLFAPRLLTAHLPDYITIHDVAFASPSVTGTALAVPSATGAAFNGELI